MPKYEKKDVSEQQLEDIVRRFPDYIESGLQYVDHQLTVDGGRLDVLMIDSGKSLVVAELKVVEDDDMLLQGLDYYDYVTNHREAYARLYKKHEIKPAQEVRLFLIAPSFSMRLINRCKWFNVPISLFRFDCLLFDGSTEITPVFNEQTIPSKLEVPSTPHTPQDILGWITDADARQRADIFLADVIKWGPTITQDATQSDISLKVNNRVFAYLYPRRRYFHLGTYDKEGEWITTPVKSDEDYARAVKLVRDTYDAKK